jgi:hemoglobin/transferrin/lactoferrin receptor protein
VYSATAENVPRGTNAYELEEIVVTASRRAESAFTLPFTVNVHSMRELQEVRQVRTIPDAMRETAGVMVQKTGHGQGSPYIRGFTGLRTLMLIDGIRLNNSTFREGPNQYWNTVDPLSVSRLELVKGPSSVLYGSDAIGGTVNVITRGHGDLASAENTHSRIMLRGASAEHSVVGRAEAGHASGALDFFGGVSFKDFGDLRAGSGTGDQPKTGYTEQAADLKFNLDLGNDRNLVAAVQHVDQEDAWRTHKTIYGKSWRNTTVGNELQRSLDQRRTLAYVQYRAADVTSTASDLVLSLSYHQQDEERLRIRNDGRQDVQGTEVGTFGLWGQLDLQSDMGLWTIGAELYHDDVSSFRRDYNADGTLRSVGIQGPVGDDASYRTAAVFIQNQYPFGDNTVLFSGLRYTSSRLDAGNVQDPLTGDPQSMSGDWSDVVGSLRLSHKLSNLEKARFFVGASQGFRAPNLSDMTRLDSARSNEIETPVAGLDAERFLTYELGMKLVTANMDGQISLFYTSIDDLIIRTPTGRIIDQENEVTKQNSGQGFVKGIELQAQYQLSDSWSVFGNLTWLDGEVDTYPTSDQVAVREPLDRLMPTTMYLGTRWQPSVANYWLEGLLSMAGDQDKLSTRDQSDTDRIPQGGTPGFTVVTIRGGWQFSESLSLSLSLENLLDENYRVHGSGLNEPGRNIIVSLLWTI